MTIEEIDGALAEWQSRLRRIDENLVALQLDPVHTRLEQNRDGGLDGVTRDRVVPALAGMRELFAQRGLLYDLLGRATRLRAGINRWRSSETLREIENLLRGPSIVLPAAVVPLARRSLLGASVTAITPDQLLSAMVASFDQARDAVAAVERAWQQLDAQCARADAEIERLQTAAGGLGDAATAGLGAARSQLEAVRRQIGRDPLGASQTVTDEVFGRIRQFEQQLVELRGRRDEVGGELDRARTLLAGVRTAAERAAAARERCAREIALAAGDAEPGGALDPGSVDGLARWLATLEATTAAGHWEPAEVGLARWLTAARETLAVHEAAERATLGLVDRRDDLLGRLLARRQQARVRASRGQAVDPALDRIGKQAEALLRRVPTPLSEAATLVADYEARLRAGG
jgi:hypothetical protein